MPDYSKSEHLILDGYNLIHAIPEVRNILKAHGITAARERFQELVSCLHEPGLVRLTIVYDGQGDKRAEPDCEREGLPVSTQSQKKLLT